MSSIIAGRFETQARADTALSALAAAGLQTGEYGSFYLAPAGQHAKYGIGGDAHHDEGTKDSGKTALTGGAIGGATGAVLGGAVGAAVEPGFAAAGTLAGAGVGAYVGSLAGGLAGTRSGDADAASRAEPVERASGIMVAVCVDRAGMREKAIEVLRAQGALELEQASGEWRDGVWADFDPRCPPVLIDAPAGTSPRGPAGPRPENP
ncbi:MAG TPA: hypothetical protein VED01_24455 [Burkholderiales bacterium]|nr:hypothetical protein [Burkholderiales bacterium]